MRRIILLCILVVLIFNKLLANDSLNIYVQDFDYLITILEETHPDPYSGFGGRPAFLEQKNC